MSAPVSARKNGDNTIYSTGPDVCWTPMGSTFVQVAYNSIVFLSSSTRTLPGVRDNKLQDFNLNSRGKGIMGHEPGIGRGVKVPGYENQGYAAAIQSSSTVFTNGRPIVRDGDPAEINGHQEGPPEDEAPWQREAL